MKRRIVWALAALLLGLASGAQAQIASGSVYGLVTDPQGAPVPGATVTLSGDFGTRTTISSGAGEFHFLQLDTGAYKISVAESGFATVTREVRVTTAESVNLAFTMKVAAVAETVEVSAETPLVDVKKRGTSTTMVEDELEKTPNARDPWGVLKNVPGVVVDRVNIAGNNNGQQAGFGGHGSVQGDATFTLDGVVITDMTSTGSSPAYFDFDAFQEIAVTTGGTDLNVQTGGIGINMVTKRGTNKFHGGAHYLFAGNGIESSNLPSALAADPRLENPDGSFRTNADHIDKIEDYGAEFGGPILKDKLWFYGTGGRQQVNIIHLNGAIDDTTLTSYNGKLNWEATPNTMVSAFWFNNIKAKEGRLTGVGSAFGLNETPGFTWNQGSNYADNPYHGLWKLQVDEAFSPDFFVSAKAAYYNTGFSLQPVGGSGQSYTYDYASGNAIGSYFSSTNDRPQKSITLDGSYFFEGVGGRNELKFGFGYKTVASSTTTHYNGNGIAGKFQGPGTGDGLNVADVHRDGVSNFEGNYTDFYVGDVYTKNRLSVNLGVRFDEQRAKNDPSNVPANVGLPNVLPAISYAGDSNYVVDWTDWSPRVGLSYAFDDQQKTVGRLSYARYAQQLAFALVTAVNPVAPGALAYSWNDLNGDKFVQPNEVLLNQYQYSYGGVNPAAPGTAVSPNYIDKNLTGVHSSEVIAGIDHELMPSFAVGIAYIWRRNTDFAYYPRLAGACSDPSNPTAATCPIITGSEYTPTAPVTSNGYTVQAFAPPAALVNAGNNGRIVENQPGYDQTFNGVDLTLTKRMSHKWMGRMAFTYNLYKQDYAAGIVPVNGVWGQQGAGTGFLSAGAAAYQGNPTPNPNNSLTNDLVGSQSAGSGPQTFYESPKWQLYTNAMYQLPWDLELSGAVFGRQGQIEPLYLNARAGLDGTLHVLATPSVETNRYPNVWDVDFRLAKNVKMSGATLTFSAEAFNIFNANTLLQAGRQVNSAATYQQIQEIMSPRILRLGARVSF